MIVLANYDAVAKEKSHLIQQLDAQQRDIEILQADKARLLSEKKRLQETSADGEYKDHVIQH